MTHPHEPDETVTDEEIDQSIRTLHRLYGDTGMDRINATLRAIRKEHAVASGKQAAAKN